MRSPRTRSSRDPGDPVRRACLLAILLAAFAGTPRAQDATGLGGLPQGKSSGAAVHAKTMSLPATYAFGAKSVQAPVQLSGEGAAEAPRHPDAPNGAPRAGCEVTGASLCYDASDNHIVYRPARMLMPTIRGLTAENISVRRHGIRFKYSFP